MRSRIRTLSFYRALHLMLTEVGGMMTQRLQGDRLAVEEALTWLDAGVLRARAGPTGANSGL